MASAELFYKAVLKGTDVHGADRHWDISVSRSGDAGACIVRRYGKSGGKLAESVRCVKTGKNMGKKNETTPLQQAVKEAKAMVKAQVDAGLTLVEGGADHVVADAASAAPPPMFPMLAQEFGKHAASKLVYPCIVQPKLDGIRLVATGAAEGGVRLQTRNGKWVLPKSADGFASALQACLADVLAPGVSLDGEMYLHGEIFQAVASKFKNDSGDLAYFVYDMYNAAQPHLTTRERLRELARIVRRLGGAAAVTLVDSVSASDEHDVHDLHQRYVDLGYEGVMVRNAEAPYEAGKRSYNLLKLKTFVTAEFEIVDVVEAEGNDSGTAVFVCRLSPPRAGGGAGLRFNVRLKASREERKGIWQLHLTAPASFVGKMMTVQFQELTATGIPRFPVGISVRDYE